MGKDRQAEGTVLLCLVLRPCWPAGGVLSRPLKCCHAEFCSHRYGHASHFVFLLEFMRFAQFSLREMGQFSLREMGQNEVSDHVLGRFASFLLQ